MSAAGKVAGPLSYYFSNSILIQEITERLIDKNSLALTVKYQAEIQHSVQRRRHRGRRSQHFAVALDLGRRRLFRGEELRAYP